MDEKQWRVEALLDLYKQQMEHYHHTQEVEWKANLGVWTLLAGAIYIFNAEPFPVCHWVTPIVLLIFVVVHGCWLYKIHSSEEWDKTLWSGYREEALKIILCNDIVKKGEESRERTIKEKLIWLVLEVGVTLLLCAVLWVTLTK
jgi:hypothetical protein